MLYIQIAVIVILLILSAFFSSSETALTTISPHRLKTLVDENVKHAVTLEKVLSKKEKMLSVILICNNIVNLTASSLTTVVFQKILGSKLIGLGTGILTLLVLIFGEIAPKTMASYRAERMGLEVSPVIYALMILFTPIAAAINFLAGGVIRLFGVRRSDKPESYTENEIRSIVEVSHEEGVTTSEEKEIINNVFDFSDTTVREVMVPRINVTAISVDSTYQEIMNAFKEDYFTRLPVYDEEGEHFIGIVNVKDLVFYDPEKIDSFQVRDVMREVSYTYEGKHLSELLMEMKAERTSLMVVLDEYGSIAGIVTMEDLLEEIVGDIRDEYDENEEDEIVKVSDNEYLIQGHVSLEDINDVLGTSLSSEDYDSIGGLLIEILGRLPEEGDEAENEVVSLKAEKVDQNRIELVRLKLLAEKTES
ncbi:MAG: HlyC/CorC family transporter [Parasporobacterium sp.]|nr:HlyC/CorC family transporter [Parasporobacterium sp.]